MSERIAIIGAGHAAGELAAALRQNGHEGGVTLIGEEPYPPYQRPPLSKAYLSKGGEPHTLYLRPQSSLDSANIQFIGNTRVDAINRMDQTLALSSGETLSYDKLAIATGARVRRLTVPTASQAEKAANFHYLRTIEDVARLRAQLLEGRSIVIVGGGYIGLEVAATAVTLGLHVTVLEMLPRVLARVTAPEISAFYEQLHRAEGVDLRTGIQVKDFDFDATGTRVTSVMCSSTADSNETRIPVDLVVVGVGVIPNTELAKAAGLEVNNGITVDEFTRTSDANIVAAGDCTSHPNAFAGRNIRLESVQNAVEQARAAALTLCGKGQPYRAVPWFWSDQYGLKLQMVGFSDGYDELVIRGAPETRSFAAFYLRRGEVIAADTVGRPKEFMVARHLVASNAHVPPVILADESFELKSLMAKPVTA